MAASLLMNPVKTDDCCQVAVEIDGIMPAIGMVKYV